MPATTVLSLAPHHPFRREGSDDSLHQAPRVHDASRRRGGGMAARGAGAAATKLPTIGYLGATSPSAESQRIAAFLKRLRELGWIEGHTIAIEYRWAEGRNDRLAEFAAEFVQLKVDLIRNPSGDGFKAGDISHPDRVRASGGPGCQQPRREPGAARRQYHRPVQPNNRTCWQAPRTLARGCPRSPP